jgi:DNA-binding SARP family transcriptional activator
VSEARDCLQEKVARLLTEASREAPKAEKYLRRVVELDPLGETALQHLLCLLVRRGRKVEATRYYRRFAERLKEEMGLEPLLETRQVVE